MMEVSYFGSIGEGAKLTKRQKIVKEMFESEQSYISQLKTVITVSHTSPQPDMFISHCIYHYWPWPAKFCHNSSGEACTCS